MALTLPSSNPTRIRSSLHRLGAKAVPVYEVIVSSGEDDPLNNDPAGSETLSKKGEVFACLFYQSINDETEGDIGEFDEDYPHIIVPDDSKVTTTVSNNDRLLIDDILYEVDAPTKRTGFVVWKATAVDQDTDPEVVP